MADLCGVPVFCSRARCDHTNCDGPPCVMLADHDGECSALPEHERKSSPECEHGEDSRYCGACWDRAAGMSEGF